MPVSTLSLIHTTGYGALFVLCGFFSHIPDLFTIMLVMPVKHKQIQVSLKKKIFNLFGAILFDAMSQNVACSPLVGQESTACAPRGYFQLKSKFEITIKYI